MRDSLVAVCRDWNGDSHIRMPRVGDSSPLSAPANMIRYREELIAYWEARTNGSEGA